MSHDLFYMNDKTRIILSPNVKRESRDNSYSRYDSSTPALQQQQ